MGVCSRNSAVLSYPIPPTSERVCLVFLGIGILVSAATLPALGLTPEEGVVCPKKSTSSVAPSLAL